MVSWCSGTCAPWQGFHVEGWHCGGACMPWWGLCAAGWHHDEVFMGQVGAEVGHACCVGMVLEQFMASLACHDRMVAADLHMVKGGGGGHGLCVVRQQGLVRLEGWSEKNEKKEKK